MSTTYEGYTTFRAEQTGGILTVTFDFPPVNIQGIPMLDDLNRLAESLESDRSVKVVVFQSAHPEIFVAHADTNFLKDMSTEAVPREKVELLYLQEVLQRISAVPQATIAKIEGFARGGGHEFALACDMRFAARGKAKFMQMEVGMGILPCGGGASRMARQVGLGRALEIILKARDFDADEAEAYGTINRALDPDEIGPFVDELADRIARFPAASIEACSERCTRPSTCRSTKPSARKSTSSIRRPAAPRPSSASPPPTRTGCRTTWRRSATGTRP